MLYKSIFLKAKERIEKRLAKIQNLSQKKAYLEFELKDEILKSEKEIRNSFKKVKCIQCEIGRASCRERVSHQV